MTRFLILIALWASSSLFINADTTIVVEPGFETVSEQQACWDKLSAADVDGDGTVTTPEYVGFAQSTSVPAGYLSNVTRFRDLPQNVRVACLYVACLCKDPEFGGNESDTECCQGTKANIVVPPSPSTNLSAVEEKYLQTLCSLTYTATAFGSNPPSLAPVVGSSSSPSPSVMNPSGVSTTAPVGVTSIPSLVSSMKTTFAPTQGVGVTSMMPVTNAESPAITKLNFTYGIVVIGGNTSLGNTTGFINSYESDLIRAMDIMATNVMNTTLSSDNSRRRLRRLAVGLRLPSVITNMTRVTCPSIANATPSDICQNVTHEVTLVGGTNAILTEYQSNMNAAITDGLFATQINASSPNAPMTVIPNLNATSTPPPASSSSSSEKLSIGAIAGIVVVILFVFTILITITIFFAKDDTAKLDGDEDEDEFEELNKVAPATNSAPRSSQNNHVSTKKKELADFDELEKNMSEMNAGVDLVAEPELDVVVEQERAKKSVAPLDASSRALQLTQRMEEDDLDQAVIMAAARDAGDASDRGSFVSTSSSALYDMHNETDSPESSGNEGRR